MPKEVVIDVLPSGDIEVEAIGFRGCGCEEATKIVEELGKTISKRKKPEYNDSREAKRVQKAG
jgi:hypothetical protein